MGSQRRGTEATYRYTFELGGWTRERLLQAGRILALAFYDVLVAES
jgi:hypothetical protein